MDDLVGVMLLPQHDIKKMKKKIKKAKEKKENQLIKNCE